MEKEVILKTKTKKSIMFSKIDKQLKKNLCPNFKKLVYNVDERVKD